MVPASLLELDVMSSPQEHSGWVGVLGAAHGVPFKLTKRGLPFFTLAAGFGMLSWCGREAAWDGREIQRMPKPWLRSLMLAPTHQS